MVTDNAWDINATSFIRYTVTAFSCCINVPKCYNPEDENWTLINVKGFCGPYVWRCVWCKKNFETKKQNCPKFCSYRCNNDFWIAKRKYLKQQARKGKKCLCCNSIFDAHRVDAKFCSLKCRVAFHRKKIDPPELIP